MEYKCRINFAIKLSHSSPQGGLSPGWFHVRVVPHQCSSGWSPIRVVFHQGGLSLGWPLIRVVPHQGGLSSRLSLSLIRIISHHGGLASGWSLIRVVSPNFPLLYSVISLPAGASWQRACCTDGAETHCWGITRSTISTAVFLAFILSCGCNSIGNGSEGIMVLRRMVHSCCSVLIVLIHSCCAVWL